MKHSIIKTCKLKFCSVGSKVTSSKSSFMGWVCKEKSYLETGSCLPSQVLTRWESTFWGSCSKRISQGSKHLAGIWRLRVSQSVRHIPKRLNFLRAENSSLQPRTWEQHGSRGISTNVTSNLSYRFCNLLISPTAICCERERAREQYDNVSYNG